MTITLYDCSTAPSPRRARIVLAEKGIRHETVQVDLRAGEQLGEAFRRINPQCTVPVLVSDDGLVLTDNASIAAYLEARFPEPPLFGSTPAENAEIASWQWRVEFEGLLSIAEAMRNRSPALAGRALPGPVNYAQIPALAERGIARLPGSLREATDAFAADEVLGAAFGPRLMEAVRAVRESELELFDGASPEEVAAASRWAH